MRIQELKSLINTEVRRVINVTPNLNEIAVVSNFSIPSDQVMKSVSNELKSKTGVIANFTAGRVVSDTAYYTADMSKDIKTPVLNLLFNSITLSMECTALKNTIFGYLFILYGIIVSKSGTSTVKLGTIRYNNNGTITSKLTKLL
jgi:ATP-dependent phosphoenolpyruvate carboxykinase